MSQQYDDTNREEFRPIPFAQDYEVSNFGVVRRRTAGPSTYPGKLVKPYLRPNGYVSVSFRSEGKTVNHLVHRLVALAFHGPQPSAFHEVAHGDGNPQNNSANNLRWCLHVENQADMIGHGRSPKGERNGVAILTEEQVKEIRNLVSGRGDIARLSREMGIKYNTIYQAVKGTNWSHVE